MEREIERERGTPCGTRSHLDSAARVVRRSIGGQVSGRESVVEDGGCGVVAVSEWR